MPVKNLITCLCLTLALVHQPAVSSTDIGTVYGDTKWIAYVGSNGDIYIRKGSTDFANRCFTGFKLKGDYVMGPDGSSYKSNKSVRSAIQRLLVKKKFSSKGCQ